MRHNTWLPGDNTFAFNDGAPKTLGYLNKAEGGVMLAATFTVPNAQAGFGITYDMVTPVFAITKPPKVFYSSTSAFSFSIKDADGWVWTAPCPQQATLKERGWEWAQFKIAEVQDAEKAGVPRPTAPAPGNIMLFQFNGADGVHGEDNNIPQSISIAYVAGRSPVAAKSGTIRMASLLDRNANAHTLKVGDVALRRGTRKEIKYLGTLPFGFMIGGPSRSRLSDIPFRGPYIAGYQSGTPWVDLGESSKLEKMLDFMLESQVQFQLRSPSALLGPYMHSYLPATWDSEQYGALDTWVWDAPDGNPAWNGWQYRAFDAMSATWAFAVKKGFPQTVRDKAQKTCMQFFNWLHDWMLANAKAYYIPSSWGPIGWSQGMPLPPDSYLDPHGNALDAHDLALALKGAIHCANAGADKQKCMFVIAQCLQSLTLAQSHGEIDPMRGCFTLNPSDFESYGFQQGEIMDALALAMRNQDLLPARAKGPVLNPGNARPPVATISIDSLEFGARPTTWSKELSLQVRNMGGSDLVISEIRMEGSEAFSITAGGPVTLPSWQSTEIRVSFSPPTVGSYAGSLVVVSNDPSSPTTIPVSGVGREIVPQTIQVSPMALSFPEAELGVEQRKFFTIGNSGDLDLIVSAITVSGASFELLDPLPGPITAGQIVQIRVGFTPDAPVSYSGTVSISSNSANSPVLVDLSGSGAGQPVSDISWLTADGSILRDQAGQQVMLRSINWFGFEQIFLPQGLWGKPYKTVTVAGVEREGLIDLVARLGFNSLRITISQDVTWEGSKPVTNGSAWNTTYVDPDLNPDLFTDLTNPWASPQPVKTSIQILDLVIAHAKSLGMRVILDMHTLAPDNDNFEGTHGKWYTTEHPGDEGATEGVRREPRSEQQAIDAWVFLADRYRNEPAVCAFDIINEPHTCTWDNDPLTGVAGYYERVGAKIQAVNPNVMLVCEGITGNVQFGNEGDETTLWGTVWSAKLDEVRSRPLVMPVANKVIYSPHEYGSYLGGTIGIAHQWFEQPNYPDNMFEVWRRQWGYLAQENIAPVWIGEIGSWFKAGVTPNYTAEHEALDAQWIDKLGDYCNTYSVGSAFWALNPQGEPDGLLGMDGGAWGAPLQYKLNALRKLLNQPVADNFITTEDGDPITTEDGINITTEED